MTEFEHLRGRAVARAEKRKGLRESIYKITEGENVRWFRVEITFYPHEKWWVEEIISILNPTPIRGTRRELTDDVMRKLETWL